MKQQGRQTRIKVTKVVIRRTSATNERAVLLSASQRLRLGREIIRDPPRWGTRTKWQAHPVLFIGNEEVEASRQTNVTKVDSIITPHSSRRPLDETVVVKHNIQRRGLAPSRRTEAVHGPRGGDDAKEELICGLHWTTGTLLFTLLFWRDVSLRSETLYYQNRKGSCGQESPPAPIMLPYMPFMSQYWPFILTGVVCYLGARFLYHRSVAQDQTQDNSHKECNGKVEYKTPDQGRCRPVFSIDSHFRSDYETGPKYPNPEHRWGSSRFGNNTQDTSRESNPGPLSSYPGTLTTSPRGRILLLLKDINRWEGRICRTEGSPMASLVLTDSSQLIADGFEKLPDQIMYPYAEQYDLQKNMCLAVVTFDSQNLGLYLTVDCQKSAVNCQSAPKKPWVYCTY
uniref:Uncharacterized protein n=1 Tax=Timema bartmani TaxID=61472 RepID=A0A7R9I185_9NEOP|nr:unnamed protein product [Timema bartmani]